MNVVEFLNYARNWAFSAYVAVVFVSEGGPGNSRSRVLLFSHLQAMSRVEGGLRRVDITGPGGIIAASRMIRGRSMAGQEFLELYIGVRIPAPEPTLSAPFPDIAAGPFRARHGVAARPSDLGTCRAHSSVRACRPLSGLGAKSSLTRLLSYSPYEAKPVLAFFE